MIKYKVQNVGIDTTNLRGSFGGEEVFPFVYTSISENNDYLVGQYIDPEDDQSILVYIDFTERLEELLKLHMEALGVKKVDMLFFNADLDPKKVYEACKTLGDICPPIFGIKDPKNTRQIEGFLNLPDFKVQGVGIPLSPTEFDYSIVQFCVDHEIPIYGFNPFGGYISAARNISSFTVPYLLSFAAAHCEVVMLSGRNVGESEDDMKFLKSLIGETHNKGEYFLDRKVHKPVSSMGRGVYSSLDLGHGYKLPYNSNDFCSLDSRDVILNFGRPIVEYPAEYSGIYEVQPDFVRIRDMIGTLKYEDSWSSDIKFAYTRYKVMEYFKENYPEATMSYILIGKSVFFIDFWRDAKFKGTFLWKVLVEKEIQRTYFLANLGDDIIFREVDEEDMESSV